MHLSPEAADLLNRTSVKASANKPPPAAADKTVVKTGTVDGRKVVQYSDGSIAYVQ
jgi:hypothetical protein